MDLIIGVLVFMLAVGIIYSLLVGRNNNDVAPLRIESEVVATKLVEDPSFGVARDNQLDSEKLLNLTTVDYEELKRQFGIKNEFCIFLRDEAGNITFLSNNTTRVTGIGSGNGELNLTCMRCGGAPRYFACGEVVPDGCTPC